MEEKYKIIKELGITDKQGKWVQAEIIAGDRKGMRLPVAIKSLSKKNE